MNPPMTYFRNYPEPLYPDWKGEPVPGWGVRPVMAGPARVGVGAFQPTATTKAAFSQALANECAAYYMATPARQAQLQSICPAIGAAMMTEPPAGSPTMGEPPYPAKTGMPWWAWVGGAVVLFGVVGFVTAKRGKR